MPAGSTYTPIATTTLGSAAASYTFSSIAGTYTDLVLIVSGVNSAGDQGIVTRVGNGSLDTGNNYSSTFLYGNGTSALSARSSGDTYAFVGRMDTTVSNTIIHYMNYSNTTTFKTFLGRGNDSALVIQHVGLWRSTFAINTIQLYNVSGANFNTGTTFTLYGIASA